MKRTLLEDGFHLLPGFANWPIGHNVTATIWTGREGGMVSLRVEMDRPVDEVH
jgi:hypothetical protein